MKINPIISFNEHLKAAITIYYNKCSFSFNNIISNIYYNWSITSNIYTKYSIVNNRYIKNNQLHLRENIQANIHSKNGKRTFLHEHIIFYISGNILHIIDFF